MSRFFVVHVREVSISAGGVQDIIKSVLNALCFGILESGKFIVTKHCDTKMPMVCIYVCV